MQLPLEAAEQLAKAEILFFTILIQLAAEAQTAAVVLPVVKMAAVVVVVFKL
jgi:hypothetical protein